jgi:O-antigen ligase
MSKRKKKTKGNVATVVDRPAEQVRVESATADPKVISGPELLRRLLLGGVTMLVVARPLVLGEDPGMLDRADANPAGLLVTLLWLLLAAGWAGWRLWTKQRSWIGSSVEAALLIAVGIIFFGAFRAASYRQPALLVAWEWLTLLVVFCLVRQLASGVGDTRRMLAAVLATGVCVAAVAIYQHFITFPAQFASIRPDDETRVVAVLRNDQEYDPQKVQKEWAKAGVYVDEPRIESLAERMLMDHVSGTFAHPNALSGYLALLLPAAFGWTWTSWRSQRPQWQTIGALVCTLLMTAALWYTHSKGAMLGLGLVVVLAGFAIARRAGVSRKVLLGAVAGLAVVALACVVMRDRLQFSVGQRIDYWNTTWKIIADREHGRYFWLGVGPGNFRTFYMRYMSPTAEEEIADPHNFGLEIWATSGALALLAFLAALAFYFRSAWRGAVAQESGEEREPPSTDGSRIHWEYYLGGMAGLSLAFFIWALGLGSGAAENVGEGAITAGLRSVVWFAAFAVFEAIAWTGPTRTLALVCGVAALLVNLSVSGGIAWPSVAQPMWIVMALTLNGLTMPVWNIRYGFVSLLLAPGLAIVALLYLLLGMHPALSCQRYMTQAEAYFPGYVRLQEELAKAGPDDRKGIQRKIRTYVRDYIKDPLEKARNANTEDIEPRLKLSQWYAELWQLTYEIDGRDSTPLHDAAIAQADMASRLDPYSGRGYYALFNLNMRFAQFADAGTREKLLAKAAKQLRQASECEPSRPDLRAAQAELLFELGDRAEAYLLAQQALKLDEVTPRQPRKLTKAQRDKLEEILKERETSRGTASESHRLRFSARRVMEISGVQIKPALQRDDDRMPPSFRRALVDGDGPRRGVRRVQTLRERFGRCRTNGDRGNCHKAVLKRTCA